MRIHTVAALYVFVFSIFFHLSRAQYAVLIVTVGAVIMAEIFNTVGEELSDMAASSFHPVVRIVKDMAAGAVLIVALAAVGVGVCLFWQPEVFFEIALFFCARPWLFLLLVLSLVLSLIYVVLGPLGIRDWLHRRRLHKRRGAKK